MAWGIHAVVASVILRAMSIAQSVPWLELFAYTGYAFTQACLVMVVGTFGGGCVYDAWV